MSAKMLQIEALQLIPWDEKIYVRACVRSLCHVIQSLFSIIH